MAGTITSANALLFLSIPNVFPVAQQLQGFAADDIYDTDAQEVGETLMGVDGKLSGGLVFTPVTQNIAIQADSASNAVFDLWRAQELQALDKYIAQGTLELPTLGKKWAMNNGFLITYIPIPAGRRVLQPRRFTVRWESVLPQPN